MTSKKISDEKQLKRLNDIIQYLVEKLPAEEQDFICSEFGYLYEEGK